VYIILLQTCVNNITAHTEKAYENFIYLQNELSMAANYVQNSSDLQDAMNQLIVVLQDHRSSTTQLFDEFMESKVPSINLLKFPGHPRIIQN